MVNIKQYIPQILPYEQPLQYSLIAFKKYITLDKITEINYKGSKISSVVTQKDFFEEIEFFNKYYYQLINNNKNNVLKFSEKLYNNSNFDNFTLFTNILPNITQDDNTQGMGYVDLFNSNDVNSKLYAIRSFNSQSSWIEVSKYLLNGSSQRSGTILKMFF